METKEEVVSLNEFKITSLTPALEKLVPISAVKNTFGANAPRAAFHTLIGAELAQLGGLYHCQFLHRGLINGLRVAGIQHRELVGIETLDV